MEWRGLNGGGSRSMSPRQWLSQQLAQMRFAPRQSRHDCANWNLQCLSNLLVRVGFHIKQKQRHAKGLVELLHGLQHGLSVHLIDQFRSDARQSFFHAREFDMRESALMTVVS